MLARLERSDFSSIANTSCEVFGLFRGASTQSPARFQGQDPKDADYVLDHSGKQGISPPTSAACQENFKGKSHTVAGPGRGFAGCPRAAMRAIDHSSPIYC
jgi:hypothetical protein